jgi:hypothetical protein
MRAAFDRTGTGAGGGREVIAAAEIDIGRDVLSASQG